ncbi:MAG: LacI family DNA-binding transcriptional regulator [Velocimicrobium sp.]
MSAGEQKKRDVSIKDIADMASVSVATVSRVINQNGRYSVETEARVRRIMKEYDYKPNLVARGLRMKKVDTIGVIIPDITNEFFSKIALELQMGLFKQGFAAMICNTNEDGFIENQYIQMLNAQQVSGVIYISGNYDEKREQLNIPTVYIDRRPKDKQTKSKTVIIESNNMQGGYLATRCLCDSNAKRIACISLDSRVSTHEERVNGCKKALKEVGLFFTEQDFVTVQKNTMTEGYQALQRLLLNDQEIDGIFCTSDILAAGALKYLEEAEIEIPSQMRLVGYDDTTLSQSTKLPITTIRQPIAEMGKLAVENILAMVSHEKIEKKEYILPVVLVKRCTT